jgi:hypothetical protein
MLLAIGLQESKFEHRRQMKGGPARGFWQFEKGGGVGGVLNHRATQPIILPILETMHYPKSPGVCHTAIEQNDVLAACFARLNLWWLPDKLPKRDEPDVAYGQYLEAWAPGKPHPDSWDDYFALAWDTVTTHENT